MSIRVLHLIKSLGRGGAEMLLPEGLRFADRERFEYHYAYFLPWKDAMVQALEEQGVEVKCFDERNNARILMASRRVLKYAKRKKIDLIHAHMPIAGAVGRYVGRRLGIPVVYSEHNLQERFHPVTRILNKRTWNWQSQAIAVSGDVADSIRSHLGSKVPVRVVLNGVDVDHFRRNGSSGPNVRKEFGIDEDAPIIGTVAVFRTQKRLDHWLTAARLIREKVDNVNFFVVGDGPLKDEVMAAIKKEGLEDVVHLPGLREDVRPFLGAMDIYMMSSIFEGLPVALLEAMAFECAPVCTFVGGIPEVVVSGENGMLVPPERPEELAAAAVSVLKTPGRSRELGQAARRTVIDGFSMERMTRELENIYDEVLSAND